MNGSGQPRPDERPLGGPPQLAGCLGGRPVTRSPVEGWEDVVLHRFRDLPPIIDLPPMRDEILVCHMGGPFLAEVGVGTPQYERRWIGPGDLGVNPAGAPVRREVKGRPDVVFLHIPPARLREVAGEMFDVDPSVVTLVPTVAAPDETAERLIALLLVEATSPGPGSPMMVQSLTRTLMVHVLREHSNLTVRSPERVEGMSPGRVRRVVDFMREHLDEALSLDQLARVGGLSVSRFVRAFHKAVGQPPHRFLVGLRLEQARRLLEQTDLSVTDVALSCGFEQPSHFATSFRKVAGMSPRTWRRERRG